jgi:hypothetical protein
MPEWVLPINFSDPVPDLNSKSGGNMRDGVNEESGVKCNAVSAGKAGLAHGVGEWVRKSVNIQDGWRAPIPNNRIYTFLTP